MKQFILFNSISNSGIYLAVFISSSWLKQYLTSLKLLLGIGKNKAAVNSSSVFQDVLN